MTEINPILALAKAATEHVATAEAHVDQLRGGDDVHVDLVQALGALTRALSSLISAAVIAETELAEPPAAKQRPLQLLSAGELITRDSVDLAIASTALRFIVASQAASPHDEALTVAHEISEEIAR